MIKNFIVGILLAPIWFLGLVITVVGLEKFFYDRIYPSYIRREIQNWRARKNK